MMTRQRASLIAAVAMVGSVVTFAGAATARAQDAAEAGAGAGAGADEGDEAPVAKQEIGARLGAQIGLSSLTPGGFRLGGVFLYRLDETTWFDGEAAVSFGADPRTCFYTRAEELTLECDHSGFDGFGMTVGGGLRFFLERRASGFHPYVRTGLGLSFASFSADGVGGAALFGWGGAGGRFRIAPRVAIGAEALLLLGPGLYDSELGVQLFGALVVQFGIEIAL